MDAITLRKWIFQHFFIIYAGTMLGTLFFCLIFNQDAQFSLNYFLWMLFFSLCGDLPILVFYSKEELSEKQMAIRTLIHFVLLEAVLLGLARFLEMYTTLLEGVVFAVIIIAVYILNRVVTFMGDSKTADKVNAQLAIRRHESQKKE